MTKAATVGVRNLAKFTGKLCQGLFLNEVAGLRPTTLLKKRLWHRCFPVIFEKFLRTPFLQNTSGRLLLNYKFYVKGFANRKNIFHKCTIHSTEILWEKMNEFGPCNIDHFNQKTTYKGNIALDKELQNKSCICTRTLLQNG